LKEAEKSDVEQETVYFALVAVLIVLYFCELQVFGLHLERTSMADMKVSQEKLDKIRAFVTRGRDAEEEYNRNPLTSDAVQQYNRKVDDTIQSLQEHVKRQEDALRQVCSC
jgi:hypothetical protein